MESILIASSTSCWFASFLTIIFNFTVYDYRSINRTISPTAGSLEYYDITLDAYLDGLPEELEGFVLYLDVIESELDPRDVGQVNLSRSVYLVVINQSGTCRVQFLKQGKIDWKARSRPHKCMRLLEHAFSVVDCFRKSWVLTAWLYTYIHSLQSLKGGRKTAMKGSGRFPLLALCRKSPGYSPKVHRYF